MVRSLRVWCDLYDRLKYQALCVDIETTCFNGPISVVGTYQPKPGVIEAESFIKGQNLSTQNLKTAFSNCRLLVTFNGLRFDIPHIKKWFPGAIPNVPVIDLYLFAKKLDLNASLKTLEHTFRIDRFNATDKRGIAIKLWKRYERYHDPKALDELLRYNQQDTVNLYPLAEQLVIEARKQSSAMS